MKKLLQASLAISRGPIARSSISSLAVRLAGLAISFVQAFLAARILGAQGYGVAAVALSATQIGAALAAFGFGPLAVREVARREALGKIDHVAEFVRAILRWTTLLAVLVGGVLSLSALAGWVPEAYRPAVLIGGLAVVPIALLQVQRGIAQGRGQIVAAQVPGELLRPGLLVVLLCVILAQGLHMTPHFYVGAFAVTGLVALTVALPLSVQGIPRSGTSSVNLDSEKSLGFEALPFFAIALTAMLMGEINTLLLGWLASPAEAGLFQPVARLAPLMVLPVQAAEMRFAPRVSELWERGNREQIDRLSRTFTYSTLALTAVVSVGLAAAGPWLLSAFGPEFAQGAELLWVIASAQVASAACGPAGIMLSMRGRAYSAFGGRVVGLISNIALGLWLIGDHGAWGAAIAMAGGIMSWKFATLVLSRCWPRKDDRSESQGIQDAARRRNR